MAPGAAAAAGRFSRKRYFPQADWLWNPIPANPVLDSNSATWAGYLSAAAPSKRVCDIIQYGVALRGPGGSAGSAVTASTPKYDVTFSNVPAWGPDPHSIPMAIPDDVVVPGIAIGANYDGHVATADPTRGAVHSLWRAVDNGATWGAQWGRQTPLYGDGRESGAAQSGSSTGARLSRYASVVRASEMTAAAAAGYTSLNHALFFSTNVASAAIRYPASVGDGANMAGVATPIPEGARIQLNPSINVDTVPGITTWERIIAKTLQKYGAYCGDNGGERMAFLFEYLGEGATPNQPYIDIYPSIYDYFDMVNIPWASLRVLRQWDGL